MYAPDLPAPVLFHPFKHHLGFIKAYIRSNLAIDATTLKADLLTLGTSQLDLYFGPLSPEQIAQEVVEQLHAAGITDTHLFSQYLQAGGTDYRCLTLSDQTDWVLRWGVVDERYVHLHPARYASHTTRVKAAALKTAIATVIVAAQAGLPANSLATINKVRTEWLGLSPVKWVSEEEGIGKFLRLLLLQLKA